jgi:predicted ester cyclase
MAIEENKRIIRRYYDELWNNWDLAVADELIAPEIAFRGSLSVVVQGLGAFKGYINMVRAAFPDFHNTIEELIAEGDKVVARITYTGTHGGELFGIRPAGKRVAYAGVAIFLLQDEQIRNGWVLGDTMGLIEQLKAG